MKANIIKETSRGYSFIDISDELLKSRKIFFTGEVNAENCNDLIEQLMYLENSGEHEQITLYINSPGGEVTSGLAVYDYIQLMHSPVRTVCIGTAASMGAILFLAGEQREMLSHSKIMIHDPSYNSGNYGGMKPHEIQEMAADLSKTRDVLCKIIAERSGKSLKEIEKITMKDTYYTADEAVEFGLANKIITKGESL